MKKLNISETIKAEVTTDNNGALLTIDVGDLLIRVLRAPRAQNGADYESMALAIDVIRKINDGLKNKKQTVLLENSEHAVLTDALKSFRYAFNEPALFDWIKKVAELPDVEVKAKK